MMDSAPAFGRNEKNSLDFAPGEFEELLREASAIVARLYTDLDSRQVYQGKSPSEVKALFDEPLPRTGADIHQLLQQVERDVFGPATLSISPSFFGYIMSGGNQAGILGEMLASAIDQNGGKWNVSPSLTEVERRVIQWIAEFVGYPLDTAGVLVSGGSQANLTCLAAARRARAPFDVSEEGLQAGPPLTVYISVEGHSCHDKAMDMLGLGKRQLRKIPVGSDFAIDLEQLETRIIADRAAGYYPICIVGNGGTVNTGGVDPLNAMADLAEKHGLWFHVDAAYGGPAAATEAAGHLFAGMERADSVALDPHKWLFAPFEAGCAMVRNPQQLRDTFSLVPPYLQSDSAQSERFDFMEYNFQLSRGFKALKIWLAFKAYGADLIRDAIQGNIGIMAHLARMIDDSSDFELMAPAPLSVVCFRYRGTDGRDYDEGYLDQLNKRLVEEVERDGRLFITATVLGGHTALRACAVNHRTEVAHVENLLAVLRELGGRLTLEAKAA